MANAYKYRPQYTQNQIGPDPSGPGASLVSGERVGKVLERVAELCSETTADYNAILPVLEERLGPLLRAGQVMRDAGYGKRGYNAYRNRVAAWDAALAALEREPGHEKAG